MNTICDIIILVRIIFQDMGPDYGTDGQLESSFGEFQKLLNNLELWILAF